jgi:hypothetical protein
MARGEVFVACPKCNYSSRIPVTALRNDNYHCSQCGNHIPLASVNVPVDNTRRQPSRKRSRKPYRQRKRR